MVHYSRNKEEISALPEQQFAAGSIIANYPGKVPGSTLKQASTDLNPQQLYHQDLQNGLERDEAQAMAVSYLQELYSDLVNFWQYRESWSVRLKTALRLIPAKNIKGLYFWGGVGRGKTYLMDLFYRSLPSDRKLRIHFHRFMQMVHTRLGTAQGRANPLQHVAESIARDVDIICFDEFFVSDIGDAMILANLLEALFSRQVVLVATSNMPPGKLYENGLQRQSFLPAIALLQEYTRIINVDGGVDYRLRSLDRSAVYYWPLVPKTEQALEQLFKELTVGMQQEEGRVLEINERSIPTVHWSENAVWFDFSVICGGPRGAADYIELSREYPTVFVAGVPALGRARDDEARRFLTLVDEFYDHNVKLVISAETAIDDLYSAGALAFAMERTRSRLQEMQTHEYLAKPHSP